MPCASSRTSPFPWLPQLVELSCHHTEPGFKGDTASNTTKPATVETDSPWPYLFVEIEMSCTDTVPASILPSEKENQHEHFKR